MNVKKIIINKLGKSQKIDKFSDKEKLEKLVSYCKDVMTKEQLAIAEVVMDKQSRVILAYLASMNEDEKK